VNVTLAARNAAATFDAVKGQECAG
jgi:hypothetical protein